jgi:hypothetical protein
VSGSNGPYSSSVLTLLTLMKSPTPLRRGNDKYLSNPTYGEPGRYMNAHNLGDAKALLVPRRRGLISI